MKNTRNSRLDELNNMNFFASGALTNLKNFHNQQFNAINNFDSNSGKRDSGNSANHYNTDGFAKINFSPRRSGNNNDLDNEKILSGEENIYGNFDENSVNLQKMAKSNNNFYSNKLSNLNCLKSQDIVRENLGHSN